MHDIKLFVWNGTNYNTLKPLLIFWKEKCPCYGYDFFYIIDESAYDL